MCLKLLSVHNCKNHLFCNDFSFIISKKIMCFVMVYGPDFPKPIDLLWFSFQNVNTTLFCSGFWTEIQTFVVGTVFRSRFFPDCQTLFVL